MLACPKSNLNLGIQMKTAQENPINLLKQWILEERQAGAPNPQQAVLSTSTAEKKPHSRVVAIREIDDNTLLFFTQKGTRKVRELEENPFASITFWFELYQRQVNIEGKIKTLTEEENKHYWQSYPREAQIRFHAYAPTSTQPIQNKQKLEAKRKLIKEEYEDKKIPLNSYYCGFRLVIERMLFYAYRLDELSDVYEFLLTNGEWSMQLLSP
jgi:pyridoxamine 5'-phosphate oxidase